MTDVLIPNFCPVQFKRQHNGLQRLLDAALSKLETRRQANQAITEDVKMSEEALGGQRARNERILVCYFIPFSCNLSCGSKAVLLKGVRVKQELLMEWRRGKEGFFAKFVMCPALLIGIFSDFEIFPWCLKEVDPQSQRDSSNRSTLTVSRAREKLWRRTRQPQKESDRS